MTFNRPRSSAKGLYRQCCTKIDLHPSINYMWNLYSIRQEIREKYESLANAIVKTIPRGSSARKSDLKQMGRLLLGLSFHSTRKDVYQWMDFCLATGVLTRPARPPEASGVFDALVVFFVKALAESHIRSAWVWMRYMFRYFDPKTSPPDILYRKSVKDGWQSTRGSWEAHISLHYALFQHSESVIFIECLYKELDVIEDISNFECWEKAYNRTLKNYVDRCTALRFAFLHFVLTTVGCEDYALGLASAFTVSNINLHSNLRLRKALANQGGNICEMLKQELPAAVATVFPELFVSETSLVTATTRSLEKMFAPLREQSLDNLIQEVADLNSEIFERQLLDQEAFNFLLREANLSAREAEVLKLFYQEEKTRPDVARLLGIKEGTVDSMLDRARRKVRSHLSASREF